MSERLVLPAIALAASSGVPGLLVGRGRSTGQSLATSLAVLAALLGILGAGLALHFGPARALTLDCSLPGAAFYVRLDGLSAVFLIPIFTVSALGAVYGTGYWSEAEHPATGLGGFFAITGSPPFGPFVSEFTILSAIMSQGRYGVGAAFLLLLGVWIPAPLRLLLDDAAASFTGRTP